MPAIFDVFAVATLATDSKLIYRCDQPRGVIAYAVVSNNDSSTPTTFNVHVRRAEAGGKRRLVGKDAALGEAGLVNVGSGVPVCLGLGDELYADAAASADIVVSGSISVPA